MIQITLFSRKLPFLAVNATKGSIENQKFQTKLVGHNGHITGKSFSVRYIIFRQSTPTQSIGQGRKAYW